MMRIQIWNHCHCNNISDYIKTHSLILTKLWQDIEQNVFLLCAKLWVCPLFDISTIHQPLFRGWGPPLRGGIVIWLARALRVLGARQHVIGLELTQNWYEPFNTLRPRLNGCHFAYDIFKWIFLNENLWISIKISLKFVAKGPINNNNGLVPIRRQAIIWTNDGLLTDRHINASLGLNELNAGLLHISFWDPNLVITMPVNVLAPIWLTTFANSFHIFKLKESMCNFTYDVVTVNPWNLSLDNVYTFEFCIWSVWAILPKGSNKVPIWDQHYHKHGSTIITVVWSHNACLQPLW